MWIYTPLRNDEEPFVLLPLKFHLTRTENALQLKVTNREEVLAECEHPKEITGPSIRLEYSLLQGIFKQATNLYMHGTQLPQSYNSYFFQDEMKAAYACVIEVKISGNQEHILLQFSS